MNYEDYVGYKHATPEEIKKDLRASNGVQITEALFEETIQQSSRKNFEPPYTLKDYEHKSKPSAYQIYMHSIDETDAALKLVGSLGHWRKLCSLNWFMNGRKEHGFDGLNQWREDMKLRDRMRTREILIREAKQGHVAAARALDRMAMEEHKYLIQPKNVNKGRSQSDVSDGLEFLDDYRK